MIHLDSFDLPSKERVLKSISLSALILEFYFFSSRHHHNASFPSLICHDLKGPAVLPRPGHAISKVGRRVGSPKPTKPTCKPGRLMTGVPLKLPTSASSSTLLHLLTPGSWFFRQVAHVAMASHLDLQTFGYFL